MKFTEAQLEKAFTELLGQEGFPHHLGRIISRKLDEVLIEEDLQTFLLCQYAGQGITVNETKNEPRPDGKVPPKVGAVLVFAGGKVIQAHRGELREGDHAELFFAGKRKKHVVRSGVGKRFLDGLTLALIV